MRHCPVSSSEHQLIAVNLLPFRTALRLSAHLDAGGWPRGDERNLEASRGRLELKLVRILSILICLERHIHFRHHARHELERLGVVGLEVLRTRQLELDRSILGKEEIDLCVSNMCASAGTVRCASGCSALHLGRDVAHDERLER